MKQLGSRRRQLTYLEIKYSDLTHFSSQGKNHMRLVIKIAISIALSVYAYAYLCASLRRIEFSRSQSVLNRVNIEEFVLRYSTILNDVNY